MYNGLEQGGTNNYDFVTNCWIFEFSAFKSAQLSLLESFGCYANLHTAELLLRPVWTSSKYISFLILSSIKTQYHYSNNFFLLSTFFNKFATWTLFQPKRISVYCKCGFFSEIIYATPCSDLYIQKIPMFSVIIVLYVSYSFNSYSKCSKKAAVGKYIDLKNCENVETIIQDSFLCQQDSSTLQEIYSAFCWSLHFAPTC